MLWKRLKGWRLFKRGKREDVGSTERKKITLSELRDALEGWSGGKFDDLGGHVSLGSGSNIDTGTGGDTCEIKDFHIKVEERESIWYRKNFLGGFSILKFSGCTFDVFYDWAELRFVKTVPGGEGDKQYIEFVGCEFFREEMPYQIAVKFSESIDGVFFSNCSFENLKISPVEDDPNARVSCRFYGNKFSKLFLERVNPLNFGGYEGMGIIRISPLEEKLGSVVFNEPGRIRNLFTDSEYFEFSEVDVFERLLVRLRDVALKANDTRQEEILSYLIGNVAYEKKKRMNFLNFWKKWKHWKKWGWGKRNFWDFWKSWKFWDEERVLLCYRKWLSDFERSWWRPVWCFLVGFVIFTVIPFVFGISGIPYVFSLEGIKCFLEFLFYPNPLGYAKGLKEVFDVNTSGVTIEEWWANPLGVVRFLWGVMCLFAFRNAREKYKRTRM